MSSTPEPALDPEPPGNDPVRLPHRGDGSHDMIQPPRRGDELAALWVLAGVAVYVLLAAIFLAGLISGGEGVGEQAASLVGLGDPKNWSLFVLVGGGIVLALVATVTVVQDVFAIRREEDDVVWILRHGREGAPLVLAQPGEREKLFERGERSMPAGSAVSVETLVDDRVRRAHAVRLRGGASSLPVEELRIIAERRTARWGSFARYASSLLLLLAVLGTFAGVKTALPELIDAVAETGAPSAGASPAPPSAEPGSNLTSSLQAVSDAFGGNALALIGAIAVGLMAQGIGVGRRHLLERLELVSAEFIYTEESAQSSDPLRAAIHALNQTAQEIQNSSGALLGIEGGLEALGSEFKSAIRSLDDRLTQILHHQESGLYERTSAVLEELQSRIGTLATVVDANTRLYGGLVDQIGERTAESTEAIAQLRTANEQISKGLEGTLRLGDSSARASETVEASSRQLADSTAHIAQQVEAIARAVSEVAPVLGEVRSALDDTTSRIQRIDSEAVQAWAQVGEQVRQKLEGLAVVISDRTQGSTGLTRDAEGMLRQIAANTNPERRPSIPRWQLALFPMIGVVAGGGVLYLLIWLSLM